MQPTFGIIILTEYILMNQTGTYHIPITGNILSVSQMTHYLGSFVLIKN